MDHLSTIPHEMPLPGLKLYRADRLTQDDVRGTVVLLQDARLQLNAMQSQLVSAGLGPMTEREVREAHKIRGDNLRLWDILGIDKNIKQDIFQTVQALMERNEALARENHDLRNRMQAYVLREEVQQLLEDEDYEPHQHHLPAP
jgi:hypothetical protein